MLEFDISEVLGEHIGRIVSPFDIENLYVLVSDSIMYKVVVDWDIFGVTFTNGVVSHENGPLSPQMGMGLRLYSSSPNICLIQMTWHAQLLRAMYSALVDERAVVFWRCEFQRKIPFANFR